MTTAATVQPTECPVEGCTNPVRSLGWCEPHYARWRRHGSLEDRRATGINLCTVDGCETRVKGYGLCQQHLRRKKKYGSPTYDVAAGRIRAKIDDSGGPDACWPAQGPRTPEGFVRVGWKRHYPLIHRVVFELEYGREPRGLLVHMCGNRDCGNVRHMEERSEKLDSAFTAQFFERLRERGLTVAALARAAGVSADTIASWLTDPETRPNMKSAEAVARVLDWPELPTMRSARIREITATCPRCGKQELINADDVRSGIKNAPRHPRSGWVGADPNWGDGTVSRVCGSCISTEVAREMANRRVQRIIRNNGRQYFREHAKKYFSVVSPEQRHEMQRKAAAARLGLKATPEQRRRISETGIRPQRQGLLILCWICGKLDEVHPKETRPFEVHPACLHDWRRTHPPDVDPKPPTAPHRLSSEDLAVSWEMAVLHLGRKIDIGSPGKIKHVGPHRARTSHHQGCGCNLATWFQKSRSTVDRRIENLIAAFPDDLNQSARPLRRGMAVLRAAWNTQNPQRAKRDGSRP